MLPRFIIDAPAALERLKEDVSACDLVLWLGISFEQSASCEYLRTVERALKDAGKTTPQLLVNPCGEAAFNARSSLVNANAVDLRALRATSDELFDAVPAREAPRVPTPPPQSPPPPPSETQVETQVETHVETQVETHVETQVETPPAAIPSAAAVDAPPTEPNPAELAAEAAIAGDRLAAKPRPRVT